MRTDCWFWPKSKTKAGYGQVRFNGKNVYVHRLFYKAFVGEILKGLELDHLCRKRHCFNPKHLQPVTSRENSLRGNGIPAINSKKIRCKYGHSFTKDNIY